MNHTVRKPEEIKAMMAQLSIATVCSAINHMEGRAGT